MRSLIEEFGHVVITLIIATVLISGLLLGVVLPEIQFYITSAIPEDNAGGNLAFSKSFNRADPVLTVPETITVSSGNVIVDFNMYITSGTIKAINADGDDISSNIVIKPADDATSKLYDESSKIFGNSDVATGEYKFIISVIDYTDEKYFGKNCEKSFLITVN